MSTTGWGRRDEGAARPVPWEPDVCGKSRSSHRFCSQIHTEGKMPWGVPCWLLPPSKSTAAATPTAQEQVTSPARDQRMHTWRHTLRLYHPPPPQETPVRPGFRLCLCGLAVVPRTLLRFFTFTRLSPHRTENTSKAGATW